MPTLAIKNKMRNMHSVVEAMCGELEKSGPLDVVVPLCRDMRMISWNYWFRAPETLSDVWWRLTVIFNAYVFGTSDQSKWSRANAPGWAAKAGAILAGDE